jgi:hypothetical protein
VSGVIAAFLLQNWLYDDPRPLAQAYYVWQMQWTDPVREAVATAAPEADRLMVLVGEVNVVNDSLAFTPAKPDWPALGKERAEVALVLRAGVSLGALLSGTRQEECASYLHGVLDGAMTAARESEVQVTGVQLDYDCPTSKLRDYTRLLDRMRAGRANVELSITVLPTWLKRWEFAGLVDGLAYYVLQVHSLEIPTSVDRPIVLCDTTRIPGYLRRAAWIGVPFYLALPTYGYRVAFDGDGQFTALSAEGPAPAWDASYQVRLVMTDPAEIAAVVRSVMEAPPRGCRGFAWFRLPHSQDELNWSWPTLMAVRDGRAPRTAFEVEIRNPSYGLYEAWLKNVGDTRVWTPVAFDIHWEGHHLIAHDTIGGFKGVPDRDTHTVRLVGPPPHNAEPAMTAWFRTEQNNGEQPVPLRTGPVEMVK